MLNKKERKKERKKEKEPQQIRSKVFSTDTINCTFLRAVQQLISVRLRRLHFA